MNWRRCSVDSIRGFEPKQRDPRLFGGLEFYTLRDVTRLPTGGWPKFLGITGLHHPYTWSAAWRRTASSQIDAPSPDPLANAHLLSNPCESVLRPKAGREIATGELKVAEALRHCLPISTDHPPSSPRSVLPD
jgi:hypothetical protein